MAGLPEANLMRRGRGCRGDAGLTGRAQTGRASLPRLRLLSTSQERRRRSPELSSSPPVIRTADHPARPGRTETADLYSAIHRKSNWQGAPSRRSVSAAPPRTSRALTLRNAIVGPCGCDLIPQPQSRRLKASDHVAVERPRVRFLWADGPETLAQSSIEPQRSHTRSSDARYAPFPGTVSPVSAGEAEPPSLAAPLAGAARRPSPDPERACDLHF